jgi:hypothetical protein
MTPPRNASANEATPAEELDNETAQQIQDNLDTQTEGADHDEAWDAVHEHQQEVHGEDKADQVFRALRQDTEPITLDGAINTEDGVAELDVELEVYRVPLEGLLAFIGDWQELQALGDLPDGEELGRVEINGQNPKRFANELAEDAYQHVDDLVVNPYESGFHSQRLRQEPHGLEVAVEIIMTAADAFGDEVDEAGNTERPSKGRRSQRS